MSPPKPLFLDKSVVLTASFFKSSETKRSVRSSLADKQNTKNKFWPKQITTGLFFFFLSKFVKLSCIVSLRNYVWKFLCEVKAANFSRHASTSILQIRFHNYRNARVQKSKA